ncbi:hypothetical protein ACW0JT_18355 [Arthrobacter sp. SA17]
MSTMNNGIVAAHSARRQMALIALINNKPLASDISLFHKSPQIKPEGFMVG